MNIVETLRAQIAYFERKSAFASKMAQKSREMLQEIEEQEEEETVIESDARSVDKLPDKQREVFDLMTEGLTAAKIADKLGKNPKTVYSQLKDIRQTLNIPDLQGLEEYAVKYRKSGGDS